MKLNPISIQLESMRSRHYFNQTFGGEVELTSNEGHLVVADVTACRFGTITGNGYNEEEQFNETGSSINIYSIKVFDKDGNEIKFDYNEFEKLIRQSIILE